MIRTAAEYLDSIRDGRQVWINGEKVHDVPTHPMFKPVVDIRARIYEMQHDAATRHVMTYEEEGETFSVGLKLPYAQEDWYRKREATDAVMDDVGGIVTRVGDESVCLMWCLSLWLAEVGRASSQDRASISVAAAPSLVNLPTSH